MNANEAKWNEVSISRLTTNVLQQKVIIFRCEPSERTLSVRLNFQIFPSLVAPLSSSLSYIIIFFYKLTFNSTPFHLLTPSSCIGSRLLSSSRYYYFSLSFSFFLSPLIHPAFSLCLTDSPTLSFALSVIRYIYIYNKYIYIFLAHRHADWTGACESSRYSGGPPTGPPVAGKVSSFRAE